MDIHNIQRRRPTKTRLITIRVTPEVIQWLKRKNYSATGIFYEALRQLGYNRRGKR
jgi:hypothetical protein